MHRTHRLFFLLGLLLLFSVFFAYLYYVIKYNPFPPKPPVATYRIPASDSTSFSNTFLFNFENYKQPELLSTERSFSGKHSLKVMGKNKFSLLIQKPFAELKMQNFTEARIGAWINSDTGNRLSGKLMFQIVDKRNTLKYSYAVDLNDVFPQNNHWFYISGKAMISNYNPELTDIIKVYYWNNCQGEVFIDDLMIVLGSQQFKGTKPLLDETTDHFKFVAQPNRPPYQTIIAQKIVTINVKNASILSTDGKTSLEIKDRDGFIIGHFIASANKTDQILLIRNHLPYAFVWFVAEKNEFFFRTIDQKTFPLDLTIIQLVAADINGDGTDEIIYISGNPQNLKVYSVNGFSNKVELLSEQKSQMHNGIKQVQKIRIKGKSSESLFVGDLTGATFLLSFEKNKWITNPLGNVSEASQLNFDSQIISGNFIKAEKNDNILLLYHERKTGKCFYKLFDIDAVSAKSSCLQQGSFDNKCDTLYPENTYFAEDVNDDGISELISYGNSWRFEMKLIRFTENNYQIMGNIDFSGYDADHNPKYYENLMITAGHFTDSKTFSFFTVGLNNKPINDLPETLGIYSLKLTNPTAAK